MSLLPATQRFTTPLWRCNGFNSDPFKRKERQATRELKTAQKKAEARDPATGAELPVLHVFAEGRRKGVLVVPKALRDACGADAAILMAEISTHAPTFQHNQHDLAVRTGMSLTRVRKACTKLIEHKYAARVALTTGEHGHGSTLQTNANGNIVRLTKAVRHHAYADGPRASATQRKKMRRNFAGLGKKGREACKSCASTLDEALTSSEPGGSGNFSPAPLIMVTQTEMKDKPQTPLADAERGSSSFLILVDGSPIPPQDASDFPKLEPGEDPATVPLSWKVEACLDSPELKAKYPMDESMENDIDTFIEMEEERQLQEIADETAEIIEGATTAGIPVTADMLPAKIVNFSRETFALWRQCNHYWGQGYLDKPWEMQAALDLRQAPPSTNNHIARAMLAPQLFFQGCGGMRSRAEVVAGAFHGGYQWLSEFTDELNSEDPELGLEEMPRHLTQGDNALLWMQTHRVGLVFLASVKNPEALTAIQAAKLVRKLRKGTVTMRHIFRLWLLAHYGNKMLTVEEACEVLRMKFGMELRSMDDIEGYRLALRRMRDANRGVTPKSAEDRFDFSFEFDDAYDLDGCMREGKQLLEKYTQAMRAHQNVEAALLAVRATGATSAEDSERLAHMWLQAQIDQNEDVLQQLKSWGAVEHLRDWTTKKAAGRQWLSSVGRQWNFTHLPEIAQTLGWASYTEWWMLNELRHYAMRKAWDAFVDVQGGAHSIWSNSLLDRKN